jgi:hypothetical protein
MYHGVFVRPARLWEATGTPIDGSFGAARGVWRESG